MDDGVEGRRGFYYFIECSWGGDVGDYTEVELGEGHVGEVGGDLVGFGLARTRSHEPARERSWSRTWEPTKPLAPVRRTR